MNSPANSSNPAPESVSPKGLYDVVMFVAQSFGKGLPVIVIIALLAYGAWYYIGRINEIDKRVSQASQTEAAAKTTAAQEKYESLLEQSKQLNASNLVVLDVSKRMQDLVSTQISNMKQIDEKTRAYQELAQHLSDADAQKFQSERDKLQSERDGLQAELQNIKAQIGTAKEEKEREIKKATISHYSGIKADIAEQLDKGRSVDPQVLDSFLGKQLDIPTVREQAISDIDDNKEKWNVRLALALQMFKKTSDRKYFDKATSMLKQHLGETQRGEADLLARYDAFSMGQEGIVVPAIAGFIANPQLSEAVRDDFITSYWFKYRTASDQLLATVGQDAVSEISRYAGRRLVAISAAGRDCFESTNFLDVLQRVSPGSAASVYASRARKNVKGRSAEETQCILEALGKCLETGQPTAEMLEQWP